MITDCRPTLRCLQDDLPNDWDSAADRLASIDGANSEVALADLKHPIIRKAAEDFPADTGDADVARESISGLSDPVWWKVKTGARWRGAVWVDPATGQAWLCAAGYRREREATDFYKSFMASVAANGAEQFLPTTADQGRLGRELRAERLDRWSEAIQAAARAEVRGIWNGGVARWSVAHPGGNERELAEVEVTVEREELDGEAMLDLVVEIRCKDYASYPLVQWIEVVVLTALDPREQQWSTLDVAGVPTHSQFLFGDEIAQVQGLMEAVRPPATVEIGSVAHYAHRARLTESIVEGEGVKSLCGSWFVPRQDHQTLDKCTVCNAIYQALPDS